MAKLKDDELKELFIKIVRPYEEDIKTRKKKIISYVGKHEKYIETLINLKTVGEKEFKKGISKNSQANTFIFYQKAKEGLLISFIKHLRNCVAHCSIDSKKNASYQFQDMDKNKCCSMFGNIDVEKLHTLMEYIHNESKRLNTKSKSTKKRNQRLSLNNNITNK